MDHGSEASVAAWIAGIKTGEDDAVRQLWQAFFDRLVNVARGKLGSAPRRVTDEEDLALSAMHSLCRGAAAGRFNEMRDRDDLWRILVAITNRKVVDKLRHDGRAKRGGGVVRGESVFGQTVDREAGGIDRMEGPDASPDFLVQMDEETQRLLAVLPADDLRQVCQLRMEGYANDEIAERLEKSVRSVERKLQIIREIWMKELEESN